MDIIPPNDSDKFNQERLDKITEILDKTVIDTGFKKIMHKMWRDELIKPISEQLTLSQIVERYDDVLTEQELENITKLINKDGKEKL